MLTELPKNWAGIFWPLGTGPELVVCQSPNGFVDHMAAEGAEDGSTQFLVAGGLTDLAWNRTDEQHRLEILRLAQERWPDYPWDLCELIAGVTSGLATGELSHEEYERRRTELLETARERLKKQVPPDLIEGVVRFIAPECTAVQLRANSFSPFYAALYGVLFPEQITATTAKVVAIHRKLLGKPQP
jgi:hypothetical protein